MKYTLYIAKIYSLSIFEPIVKELEKRKLNYRFYISRRVKENFPKQWNKNYILHSIKEAKKFGSDIVLCPGNFVDFRIPGVKVELFHGLGIEKPAHYIIRHFFDIYLTSGPVVTKKFLALRDKYHKYFDVLETGWPKVDYILNYDMTRFKSAVNISHDKTTILYAPTFSKSMESASAFVKRISTLVNDDEIWFLKFHPLMDKEIIRQFKELNKNNIHVVSDIEVTPYLHLANIMISDTSSVVYEFMLLNKPVITINTIARKDKGLNVNSLDEVRNAIEQLKQNPKLLTDNIRKHLADVNPYTDGKICSSMLHKIERMVHDNKYPKPHKPFNLFRKYQIIYHSIFKKGYLR